MRVVFLGKGGSGKTTLTTLMSLCALRQNLPLLTIDGDVNIHLGPALGVPKETPSLSADYQQLFVDLEGRNPALAKNISAPLCGSLPPSCWSHPIRLDDDDLIMGKYAWKANSQAWWHVKLGNYGSVNEGGDCYHYRQNALELFVHRLADAETDIVFADSTAGVDHVATSLSMAYDLCVFNVEPTMKSISVARDFKALAQAAGLACVFVINKIESEEDIVFVNSHLPADNIIGHVWFSSALGQAEQTDLSSLEAMADSSADVFERIVCRARELSRHGRETQRNTLMNIYRKECTGYWNALQGSDLLAFLHLDEIVLDKPVGVQS